MELYQHQKDALSKMHNGCILCGTVGSGKSLTSLAYFHISHGGSISPFSKMTNVKDLYIITTAHKRDSLEWDGEILNFYMSTSNKNTLYPNQKVVIDSWNNVAKYTNVKNAFFIFDEQRVVGFGKWGQSFIKIAKNNEWILLSATPGDKYMDYGPVFIANGFYTSKGDFCKQHVIYKPFMEFPVIDRYINTARLERLKSRILVMMDFNRSAEKHLEWTFTDYDRTLYKDVTKLRYNPYRDNYPIENAVEYCQVVRRIVNSDVSKQNILLDIFEDKRRLIIFYNFDYELDILKSLDYTSRVSESFEYAEWNGHKHQDIPTTYNWVYFVQYNAGAEGWNCIRCDTIVFFSPNYSYRMMVQAAGRIDRLNTPYKDLYYYILLSRSPIDVGIKRSLTEKKKFNEKKFYEEVNMA